ncbi:MAG: carboxypeptidase M32, partial [Oscillospiraceae bacterium]|nr:carboxypeptidase M32 [Oscillospiraceae bacterium]
ASGSLKPIADWLKEKIHQHASMYDPNVLFEMVCGAPFDPSYYVEYLEKKFSDIYGV